MSKLGGVVIGAAVLGALACGGDEPRPNVLFVLVDTLRADFLSSYGYERQTSPHFDALAREGVLFENNVSQSACTYPSVNSLLTSRYPWAFIDRPGRPVGIPADMPTMASILRGAGYETLAVSASPIVRTRTGKLDPRGGFAPGFDYFDDDCEWEPAACVIRKALPLVAKATRPFFLYLHFIDPHDHYAPAEPFHGRFTEPYRGKSFIADGDPNPIQKSLRDTGSPGVSAVDLEHMRNLYAGDIAAFDAEFGAFLATLRQGGLLEKSILVVASDHGEEFLEHEEVKHCRSVYETLTRTPLLIRFPSGTPTGRRRGLAQNLDVLPTLLDYLGLESTGLGLEGRSLRPVIEEDRPVNPTAFSVQGHLRAVRQGDLKLIVDRQWQTRRLYDLARDPGEQQPLGGSSRGDDARTLEQTVEAWEERTRALEEPGRRAERDADTEARLRALGYLE